VERLKKGVDYIMRTEITHGEIMSEKNLLQEQEFRKIQSAEERSAGIRFHFDFTKALRCNDTSGNIDRDQKCMIGRIVELRPGRLDDPRLFPR